ncbi:molybdopterin-dependent oxidoreductase [Patulibacter sp. NPDC049589]|uniref:molybdopterin-dependent oxidoreductase n=1 Tax=Patulibacter sp. NPDC049589 TaxID=3154731 RepID=UPI0034378797
MSPTRPSEPDAPPSGPVPGLRRFASSAHWGTYVASVDADGALVDVRAHEDDPDAAPAIGNVLGSQRARSRVTRPAVRRRWLELGPGADDRRGDPDDAYVEVDWDTALDLLARELDRVRTEHGNAAIFGGSYGWSSAGRFHHAQSQLHRFLNRIGGYTRSLNDYSRGASLVLLPHLIGPRTMHELRTRPVSWDAIAEHTELLVTFGGLRRSNSWVVPGGHDRHVGSGFARRAGASTRIVSLAPAGGDVFGELDHEWIPMMPGTDAAVMLALIHVLVVEGLADDAFLERHTVGAAQVRAYVLGESDGVRKTPEWAQEISRVPADRIRALAREMAASRTLVNVVYAAQRGEHGEQPVFGGLTLAAFLGQLGLPGGGFSHGYGSIGDYGVGTAHVPAPVFPQGRNPIDSAIPCARISDLLLRPGQDYPYDGATHRYPDVRLAYWAGGNPFHHHQNLRRLRRAFASLETFVVHETHWTATAKHADIVLPVATTLERDDLVAGPGDATLRASYKAVEPPGDAREEFAVLSDLARRLGADHDEGLDSAGWLRRLYEEWRAAPGAPPAPDFDAFWADGEVPLPQVPYEDTVFRAFRADPDARPLDTPTGRIELYKEAFAAWGRPDVPPHVAWLERTQWWGSPLAREFDLHLVCNQPSHRLHSQQDMGAASQATKVAGREPIRLHPDDARDRGLVAGDVVRVTSPQGSLLAGVLVGEDLMRGVAQMHTGAWFDGSAPKIADCVSGNVNVLTRDAGTSALAQASDGANVLVKVERHDGPIPPLRAYDPPRFAPARRTSTTPTRVAPATRAGHTPSPTLTNPER